jgi:AcrR family transcriptional regulator
MQGDDQGGPAGEAAPDPDLEVRRAMEHSMLRLSGERGYEQTTVTAIVKRSGSNLFRFYETYASKDRCFASAYDAAAEELCTRLLATCIAAPDWIAGTKRGLLELATYTTEDPALAAGVISEVHVVGGAALEKRGEIVARLSRAVDRGHREGSRSCVPPPAATSTFVVSAIEAAAIKMLAEERTLGEALPGLLFIAVSCYFDIATARRAVRALPSAS